MIYGWRPMARLDPRFVMLLVCFFLSGLAGLIYQTAWTQQFALVFGTSELALVTVLAAYMAGLARFAVRRTEEIGPRVGVLYSANTAGAAASARVFAWNTVGTITGALAAGYLVMPALRFAGTAVVAAALSLALALGAALMARPRRRMLAAAAFAGLVAVTIVRPATPWRMLRHSPISSVEMQGRSVFYGFGRSATVLLLEIPSGWRLTTNGLPESSIDAR
jgi:hypothetical protein